MSRGQSEGSEPLVLVADDDEDQRRLLERWLGTAGYRVESFGDGYSCVEALSRSLPEAICLDLHMPGLTGMEALEKIGDPHLSRSLCLGSEEGRSPDRAQVGGTSLGVKFDAGGHLEGSGYMASRRTRKPASHQSMEFRVTLLGDASARRVRPSCEVHRYVSMGGEVRAS